MLGERILDAWGDLAVHLAVHEPVGLHLPDLLDEHLLAHAGKAAAQLTEPPGAVVVQLVYVGADPGLAQLYYQAQLDVFLTTLAGLLHGIALVGSAGVPAADFAGEALATVAGIPAMLQGGSAVAEQVDTDVHPGELSTTRMMGATADHVVAATSAAGIDPVLPEAVQSLYARAIAAGDGDLNWTSLIRVIRPRPTPGIPATSVSR